MKYQNRIMALPMLCMIIIVLSACCFDEQKNETSNVNPKVQSVETVSVTRGNLTPTVSAHTTIIPALDFVLCSSVEGTFEACSSAGNKITEGGVIGKVSEEEIKSPVDATILSIISSNESVPKNYPLATAKYTGFALNIEAENFLKILPENAALKAKFQVVDGVGPTEAIAVVVPVSENAESTLQCLIGKDIDVKPGQSATVVITAETRKDVLLLPLSVIAGRQGKGMVTVINDGKQIQTEVMLGATDGAYIEILSGVNEGDTILFPQTLTQGVICNMEKTNGGNLIQIKNLVATVNLNNGDTLVTVNKANMELKRGNSYAIVGKSGSGKTSLISQ